MTKNYVLKILKSSNCELLNHRILEYVNKGYKLNFIQLYEPVSSNYIEPKEFTIYLNNNGSSFSGSAKEKLSTQYTTAEIKYYYAYIEKYVDHFESYKDEAEKSEEIWV